MSEADYYPDGAYNDPNAPYTQVDDEWSDEAEARLQDELDGDEFVDWVLDHEYADDEHGIEAAKGTALYSEWQNMYSNERYDEILNEIYDERGGREEYYREMAAEEAYERYRERDF